VCVVPFESCQVLRGVSQDFYLLRALQMVQDIESIITCHLRVGFVL
jgi:hypothetical protein